MGNGVWRLRASGDVGGATYNREFFSRTVTAATERLSPLGEQLAFTGRFT